MKNIRLLITLAGLVGCSQILLAQYNKAANHLSNGKLKDARDAIEIAIQDEKEKVKPRTWILRGRIYFRIATDPTKLFKNLDTNAVFTAYESYKKAMELDPAKGRSYKDAKAYLDTLYYPMLNYAVDNYNAKKYANALRAAELGRELNPKDTLGFLIGSISAYFTQDFKKYKDLTEQLIKSPEVKNKLQAYRDLAIFIRDQDKDYEKALYWADEGLKKYPNDKELNDLHVELLLKANKVDLAIEKLQKVIASNPNDAINYLKLGILYNNANLLDKALEAYNKCLELDAYNYEALFNAGAIFYNRASELLKEVNNMDMVTYNKKGKPLEDKAKAELEKALPYFEKANNVKKNEVEVLRPLYNIYNSLKRKEEAARIQKILDVIDK
ncbi:MAG: tetratricopeptide repeat protein [Microscillaceae bacterium]|nr:tetratricopeptide repeat protein [Microscillaceae bacterium]MDW8461757.1 tetratricopeptide repeat protein [Cytophagales bacterium]